MSGGEPNGSGSVKAAADNLRVSVAKIEDAMDREGIDPDGPMGVVLHAVGDGLVRLAVMCERVDAGAFAAIADARATAEADLARMRTGVTAASLALNQARSAQAILEVQRETLVGRMVGDIAPQLVKGVREAVVIRERRYNRNIETARAAIIGSLVLLFVVGGYVARAVQDRDATEALGRCIQSQVVDAGSGKKFCPVDILLPP